MIKGNSTNALISEYHKLLTMDDDTNKKLPSLKTYFNGTDKRNHEDALFLFRYFFEKVMGWTPYEARSQMSAKYVDTFHLREAYNRLIFPKELKNGRNAYYYVAVMCYPDYFPYSNDNTELAMEYNQILTSNGAVTKTFLKNTDGRQKAALYLNSYLNSSMGVREGFNDIESMYLYFASKHGKKYIADAKLTKALEMYFTSPLQYFHESVSNDLNVNEEYRRDNFLYIYAEFMTKIGKNPFDKRKSEKTSDS